MEKLIWYRWGLIWALINWEESITDILSLLWDVGLCILLIQCTLGLCLAIGIGVAEPYHIFIVCYVIDIRDAKF